MKKNLKQAMTDNPIEPKIKADNRTLYLYGGIGYYDEVTLDEVKETIQDMPANKVTIRLDSYGGVATEGVAIRNLLMDSFNEIEVVIDGIAASAASVIALSGNLTMKPGSILMIHDPWSIAYGNADDFKKEIRTLESMADAYKDIYMQYFNGSREELSELMKEETWMTAEDAYAYGFVTHLEDSESEVSSDEKEVEMEVISADEKKPTTINLLNKFAKNLTKI